MAVTAVILAGGLGRRMGGVNKASLPWGDGMLIDRQLRVASQWVDEIVIVSNDDALNDRLFANGALLRIVPDLYVGEGPLAGLHAGFKAAHHDRIWLLACDQPFISLEAAVVMSERMDAGAFQAVLPVIDGRQQPLHGFYRKELARRAEELLQMGERKVVSLLDTINWCGIAEQEFIDRGIPIHFTDDVDTPEQYRQAKLLYTKD